MTDTILSLRYQLDKAEANLLIIRERIADYVTGEEVPLTLTKNERALDSRIKALRAQLLAEENQQLHALLSRCTAGSQRLLDKMGRAHPGYRVALVVTEHLVANIDALRASRHDNRDERTKFVVILNKLARSVIDASFGHLCGVTDEALLSPLTAFYRVSDESMQLLKAPEQVQSRSVRQGFDALMDLMQEPMVREIVAVFHTDFEIARERVGTLIFFKDLHDQLHTLQYKCYNLIVRDARSFPDNDLVRESLDDYQMTMREIVRTLHDIVARVAVDTLELAWIEDLEEAANSFRSALDASDPQLLNRTIRLIDRVLTTQPVYINANLIATARTLPLPVLVATLRRLREQLVKLELDTAKMAQFESGVEALSTLSQQLNELLHEHDSWQDIERELRRIEASLRLDITELEMFWNDLKQKVEALCDISIEEWALALKKDGAVLHASLAVHEPVRVREAFWRYRRQAGDRFFRVDTELKRLCDRLRQFSDPFSDLLRMTELSRAIG
jgi:hypothetical protein